MRYFIVLAVICLTILLTLEAQVFKQFRQKYDPEVVNETFIRSGRLGKILRKNDLVGISSQTQALAILDNCAETDNIENGGFHNQFILNTLIEAKTGNKITVSIAVGEIGEQKIFHSFFIPKEEKEYFKLYFRAAPGDDIYIKYAGLPYSNASLEEAFVSARFNGKEQAFVGNGEALEGKFYSVNNQLDIPTQKLGSTLMTGKAPEVTQYIKGGISDELNAENYPGNDTGYCTYTAKPYTPSIGRYGKIDQPLLLPKVNITAKLDDLYGDQGIFDNKLSKGRLWEKPASLSVSNQKSISDLKVGLRFHGGTHGRVKDIGSLRIYARKRFGIASINAEAFLGKPADLDFKTLVLKYTFQVLLSAETIDFNPFIHSLALDIADQIGAIVPRHHLIDLSINNQPQGLYLAMEHLSERTIESWLGHKDFSMFTHKNYNRPDQTVPLFRVIGNIMAETGDQALEKLKQHMDIDNVINSILLSAYIGDNDYCQGIELITKHDEKTHITSINWDLDHGFITLTDTKPLIDPKMYSFLSIAPTKRSCIRQWVYGWTYLQSAAFRTLVRDRLESLLNNQLHPTKAVRILDYYKALNEQEFSNRYDDAILDLQDFLEKRPETLRSHLSKLEAQIAAMKVIPTHW